MREEKNPYSAPFVIRGDLIFLVTRFGYKEEDILDSIINNKPTHQAVTYYLLEKDHEQISWILAFLFRRGFPISYFHFKNNFIYKK